MEGISPEVQTCRERVDHAVTGMVTQVDTEMFRKMQVRDLNDFVGIDLRC